MTIRSRLKELLDDLLSIFFDSNLNIKAQYLPRGFGVLGFWKIF